MFNKSIKNRVWAVIKQKIADAQEKHNVHCAQVDEQTSINHKEVDAQAEFSKNTHLESLVKEILGKIL